MFSIQFSSWGRMSSPKPRRTSARFVRERRVLATRVAVSTGWFRTSCVRVVISPITTAPEESPSMAPDSRTRTLSWLTPNLVYYLWQMLAPTLMAASSLSPVPRPAGSTENTSCSEKLSKGWMLLEKYDFLSLPIFHFRECTNVHSYLLFLFGNLWPFERFIYSVTLRFFLSFMQLMNLKSVLWKG